mgnify:CR=1 FL=1|tara:strand:+ start:2462 stop:3202 length:741 start_codon:yes stop_codon:yes gene_type:complete
MARISTYPVDKNITGSDILLGTDSTGGTNATKNFLIKDLSIVVTNDYLYNNSWKFTDNANGLADQTKAAIYFPNSGGANTPWANITVLRIQTLMGNNTNAFPYLDYLLTDDPNDPKANPADNVITIANRNDLSEFGIFTFTAIDLVAGEKNIYDITLSFLQGSGVIKDKQIYGIGLDPLNSQDDTFTYTQAAPATTWVINHNLAKFPSITVVDSANTVVIGQYDYTDANNVTLTFSAGFAGNAYLN